MRLQHLWGSVSVSGTHGCFAGAAACFWKHGAAALRMGSGGMGSGSVNPGMRQESGGAAAATGRALSLSLYFFAIFHLRMKTPAVAA